MHLPMYALAAAVCALRTSAFPLPIASTPNVPSGLDPPGRRDSPLRNLFPEKDGFIQTGPPVRRDEDAAQWFPSQLLSDGKDKDPLRRRDSPLHNLFPEKDGFIQTGPPVRRDWYTGPPSSGGEDDDPPRRRDSPLHNLPKDGMVESEAPGPRVEVP